MVSYGVSGRSLGDGALMQVQVPAVARAAIGAVVGWVLAEVVGADGPSWQGPAAAAVLAVAFLAAPGLDRWAGRGVTSAWALAAAGGLYLGVPETDRIVGVVAVLLVVVGAELLGRASVDGSVASGLDTVLVWAALYGAAGRGGALVAGLACLGMLVVAAPAAMPGRPSRELVPAPWRDPLLVVLQVLFVVVVARAGGVRTTTAEALGVAAVGVVLLSIAAWVVVGPDDHLPQEGPT